MRKASMLVGLTLIALGAGARAQDKVPAAPLPDAPPPGPVAAPAPAGTVGIPYSGAAEAPPPRWIELGLSFLPMGRGKITEPNGGTDATDDARLAYGVGLSGTFPVWAGFRAGLAPQAIYDVSYKVNPAGNGIPLPPTSTEYDLFARLEYEFSLADGIALYANALPGYSFISNPGRSTAKGAVLVLGGGASMDMSERFFLDLGAGYQLGYQSANCEAQTREYRTQYLRVTLGVGFRL